MCGEKHTATIEDRTSLSSICIWEGSQKGAEMNSFHNTAVSVAGRGSDIAFTSLSDIAAQRRDAGLVLYEQLTMLVTRYKTTTQRTHVNVPHRDSFHLCFYHSLAYQLVMSGEQIRSSGKIFPSFAEKMHLDMGENGHQIKCEVSKLFNKVIDHFWGIMFDLYGEYIVQ